MNKVDLHIHSVYSDGTKEPKEIIKLAKKIGLTTIALTDHDNINGSKEIVKYNNEGITIYSGVELTAKIQKGRMHILGYNIDLENEQINKRLIEMRQASEYNILLYIDILKKDFNIEISKEDIDALFNLKGNIGRPQLAQIMIKMGLVQSVPEAFDNYLTYAYEEVKSVKKGLTAQECLELINGADGIPILAHPNSLKLNNIELEEEVKRLKEMGLKGLETTHSDLNDEERKFYHQLALKYDLLESGGTDYHGLEIKPTVHLGYGINNNVSIDEDSLSLTKKIKNRYM